MYGQLHTNRVLYKERPEVGNQYRQIVAVELNQFEVRIFEGAVIQNDVKFIVDNPDAEMYFHPTLIEALEDVEREFNESVAAGWRPYVRD